MATNDHIINKQLFEFECVHSEHAFQLKNKFDHDIQYKITKVIERACDQLAAGNDNVRIPVLEIDLGAISFNQLESEILRGFEKQFYQKLLDQKNRTKAGSFFIQRGETSFEILKYFLVTGQLPWFAGKKEVNIIDKLLADVLSNDATAFRRFVLLNVDNEKLIERLIIRSEPYLVDLLISILGIDNELIIYAESGIKNIFNEIALKINLSGKTPAEYHQLITKRNVPGDRTDALARFLMDNGLQKETSRIFIRKLALEIILRMTSARSDISDKEKFYAFLYKTIAEKFELDTAIINSMIGGIQNDANELSIAADMAIRMKEQVALQVEHELAEPEQEIKLLKFYISNAGLILVANYFPVFFDQLGLLEDGYLVQKSDKIKAVFILHYLCTGKEEAPEYILPLNKILCGLPLDEPLPSTVLLTATEKKECEELLSEVILNWQKVGSLSTDGLRESFLVRDGILSGENDGWKLTVERRGYDVLLDSMPWSFNHIKLSWMQELITTEW